MRMNKIDEAYEAALELKNSTLHQPQGDAGQHSPAQRRHVKRFNMFRPSLKSNGIQHIWRGY